jgi:hypothetical protein
MAEYDKAEVANAQSAWRKQDMETWGKRDDKSISERKHALVDLLCAHIPVASKGRE